MNHYKLTQRNLEIVSRRSRIQILLFLIFIPLLAVTGLAQEPGRVKEQPESFSLPADDAKTLLSEEEAKDQDRRQSAQRFAVAGIGSRFGSLWTKASKGKETSLEVVVSTRATNDLFTKQVSPVITGTSSSGAASQPASDRSRFAVFVNAGVAVPHGDFSIFFDPGFSLNTGLEFMITPQFSAEGTLGYHRFGAFFGGNTNLYQVSGNGKFYLVDQSTRLRPFINGGVGAYVTDSATVHFGGNIGGGVLYELTPSFGLVGAYNFHAVSAGFGVRFSTVQGGIRFRF